MAGLEKFDSGIEIKNLTRIFEGKNERLAAIKNSSLKIKSGERVAIIGPSGAGKSTLLRLINCTIRPTSGELWIGGREICSLSKKELHQIRKKIGIIYQQHNLIPRFRVINNVLSGKLGRWSTPKSIVSLFRQMDFKSASEALEQVGIGDKIYSRTDELSGGQQQRVAIARLLLQDPEIILADEPVSSVDPSLAESILRLLVDINETSGKTLITSLHRVELAMEHFPRIIGIKTGRIIFDYCPKCLSQDLLSELYSQGKEEEDGADEDRETIACGCN